MNYLNRPIYVFDIDWSAAIARSFSYDVRETTVGFGSEYFVPTADNTAQGWSWIAQCRTNADIVALDDFIAALFGRLNGFWLPVPFEAMQIVAGVANNQFKIAASGLTTTWQDRPDIHLWLVSADGASTQAVVITNVVDNHDETETVTVGAALNPVPVPGMFVRRLHYVRLVEDTEQAEFEGEGWQQREMSVVELPKEYTNMETGRQPIYLYTFSAPAPVLLHWRYTSFAAPVWSGGVQYLPYPISHGALEDDSRAQKYELDIEAEPSVDHPLSLFFPSPFGSQLQVTVSECSLGNPEAITQLFKGIVRSVEDGGDRYVAHCASMLYLLDRKLPRWLIQPTCNNTLFDSNCRVRRANFETSVIIDSISNDPIAPAVKVSMAFPLLNPERERTVNWFANGIFETGFGIDYEPRSILASSFDAHTNLLTLTLNLPLQKAIADQWCQITAGCDGAASTCEEKFRNFDANFAGFLAVPQRNLTLEAFNNQPVSQGGKK